MRHLSKITLFFGAFIVISASFMLQVRNLIVAMIGTNGLKTAFTAASTLLLVVCLIYIIYKRLPIYKMAASVLCLAFIYILMSQQKVFAERLHVLEYAVLGYLVIRDLSGSRGSVLKNIIYALGFIALIGALDETFQLVLPYRYFDTRDIALNVAGGTMGGILRIFLRGFFQVY